MQAIATLMSTAGSSTQQPVAAVGNGSRLLTEFEVAKFLGVHPQTLVNWRKAGQAPRSFRLGLRRIFYNPQDVASWMAEQQYVSPAAAGS
jgi:predicted DNA-binding transcriptional regulator AlpA